MDALPLSRVGEWRMSLLPLPSTMYPFQAPLRLRHLLSRLWNPSGRRPNQIQPTNNCNTSKRNPPSFPASWLFLPGQKDPISFDILPKRKKRTIPKRNVLGKSWPQALTPKVLIRYHAACLLRISVCDSINLSVCLWAADIPAESHISQ